MKRFTDLYIELDSSNSTLIKQKALKRYFQDVPAADGAWAVYFLCGNRLKRSLSTKDLRAWAAASCGYPDWMVDECYNHVGDLAETLALLLAERPSAPTVSFDLPLHQIVEQYIVPLRELEPEEKREMIEKIWSQLEGSACFVFNKLLTGGFRVGVSQTLVNKVLASVAGVEAAVMAHRLMGDWQPSVEAYQSLFTPDSAADNTAKPYPFCLAHPLDDAARAKLGDVDDWQIEWKWDGIRAQLIKRGAEVLLWSRGEALVAEQFPELIEAAAHWPESVVLDGEILVWHDDHPADFSELQKRLGRKKIGPKIRKDLPVVFMAYDLLEKEGADFREQSTQARRAELEAFFEKQNDPHFRLSPLVEGGHWDAIAEAREASRQRSVEGLMLKRRDSVYGAGRKKGQWWKWKVEPYTIDAVLVYGQQGHGRRAGLYTDYTFSIWKEGELVPFAKAYSGLSDAEIRQVDRWIRDHTLDSHGPVRVVEPELVFEIAFEGINESKRHKSGIAVRFPRIQRWRRDKPAKEADSLETVRALLNT